MRKPSESALPRVVPGSRSWYPRRTKIYLAPTRPGADETWIISAPDGRAGIAPSAAIPNKACDSGKRPLGATRISSGSRPERHTAGEFAKQDARRSLFGLTRQLAWTLQKPRSPSSGQGKAEPSCLSVRRDSIARTSTAEVGNGLQARCTMVTSPLTLMMRVPPTAGLPVRYRRRAGRLR